MTQIIQFIPSNYAAPQFNATFDHTPYNVVVTWNISSQRYYVNVYDMNGNFICAFPLVESPPGIKIASLVWDPNQSIVVATLEIPFYRPTGQIVQYTIIGCQPTTYNGTFNCLTISPSSFSYPMLTDPGQIVVLGSANRYINMLEPWFASSMIFRMMQFQVDP
jgi:hypothetical protein